MSAPPPPLFFPRRHRYPGNTNVVPDDDLDLIPPHLLIWVLTAWHLPTPSPTTVNGPYAATPGEIPLLLTNCAKTIASLDLDPSPFVKYFSRHPWQYLNNFPVDVPIKRGDGAERENVRVLTFGLRKTEEPEVAGKVASKVGGLYDVQWRGNDFDVYVVRELDPGTQMVLPPSFEKMTDADMPQILRCFATPHCRLPIYSIKNAWTFLDEEKALRHAREVLLSEGGSAPEDGGEWMDMDGVKVGWVLIDEQVLHRIITVTRMKVGERVRSDVVDMENKDA